MRGRDQNRWGFGDRGWLNSLVQIGLTYHVTQDNIIMTHAMKLIHKLSFFEITHQILQNKRFIGYQTYAMICLYIAF